MGVPQRVRTDGINLMGPPVAGFDKNFPVTGAIGGAPDGEPEVSVVHRHRLALLLIPLLDFDLDPAPAPLQPGVQFSRKLFRLKLI